MGLLWTSSLVVLLLVSGTLQMSINSNDYDAEYVTFSSLETRKANGERLLQFRAFDQDYNLLLSPSTIFAPTYKYMEVETLADGRTAILEKESQVINEAGGQLYDVAEMDGSVYITDKDDVQVNGIINDQLVIKPVPVDDFRSGEASHIVYKRKTNDIVNRRNDYIELVDFQTPQQIERQSPPAEVTVKILVVMDNVNTLALNSKQSDLETYAAIFWNSVQRRYNPATNPRIKLAIAGLVVIPNASGQPFVTKNLDRKNPKFVEGSGLLNQFRDWAKDNQQSVTFDAAILHTGLDGYDGKTGSTDQAGLAFLARACTESGAGYGEDVVPYFTGVTTMAHELGHILSSSHDGEGSSRSCSPAVHNTMSPTGGPGMPEQWTFSQCSLNAITSYLRSAEGKCTWTAPTSVGVPLSEILPGLWGKAKSLDDFCAMMQGEGWIYHRMSDKSICDSLYCKKPGFTNLKSKGPVPEGTSCDYNKMCNNGYCTESSVPSVNQQCATKLGAGAQAVNVFDASACSSLKCSRNGQTQQAGSAKDGTSCGIAGFCKNKQCVGQSSVSLEKNCEDRTGATGFKAEQTDAEKRTCKYRCVHSLYQPMTMEVPELLPCGDRNVCRSNRCVPM